MGVTCTPLDRDPWFVEVTRPLLTAEAVQARFLQEERIDADPDLFDGGAIIVASVDGHQLNVYRGSYAELLAHEEISDEFGRSPFGQGGLGACIIPTAPDGRTLWTQRGPDVLHPGTWQFGIAGGVDWGEPTRAAVLRELAEELGLTGVEPHPLGCCTGPDGVGVYVVYGALLDPQAELHSNEEIASTAWVLDPEAELAPLHPAIMPLWRSLRDVRQRAAA